MKTLKTLLMLSGIAALACMTVVGAEAFRLIKDARAFTKQAAETVESTQKKTNIALDDLHHVLLESGLTAKEARLAAVEQRAYWAKVSAQSVDAIAKANTVLDSLNRTVLDTNASQKQITTEAIEALREMQNTLRESQVTLQASSEAIRKAGDSAGDPNIALALQHLNGTMANVEQTSKRVDAVVERLTKPQSLFKSIFKGLFDVAWKSKTLIK